MQNMAFVKNVWDAIVDPEIGSAASVLGLIVSLFGFGFTIWGVWRSKSAAEEAGEAAKKVQRDLLRFDAIEDVASAITTMDEIKRLQRVRAWALLPDRYAAVRKNLISIRGSFPELSDPQKSVLQGAIQQLFALENLLENPPSAADESKLVIRVNKVVSNELDSVFGLLVEMRSGRKE